MMTTITRNMNDMKDTKGRIIGKKEYDWEDEDDEEEEWEDDDDWEKEGNQTSLPDNQMQPSYWNVWTRDTSTSLTENLPFQEAKEVTVDINGKSESLYVVPLNGQLLVSAEKTAKLIGLESKVLQAKPDS